MTNSKGRLTTPEYHKYKKGDKREDFSVAYEKGKTTSVSATATVKVGAKFPVVDV